MAVTIAAPSWRANDASGIGHALARPRDLRAACRERMVDERRAWPVRERCGACLDIVGVVVRAPAPAAPAANDREQPALPWTEAELREAFGR